MYVHHLPTSRVSRPQLPGHVALLSLHSLLGDLFWVLRTLSKSGLLHVELSKNTLYPQAAPSDMPPIGKAIAHAPVTVRRAMLHHGWLRNIRNVNHGCWLPIMSNELGQWWILLLWCNPLHDQWWMIIGGMNRSLIVIINHYHPLPPITNHYSASLSTFINHTLPPIVNHQLLRLPLHCFCQCCCQVTESAWSALPEWAQATASLQHHCQHSSGGD